MRKPSLSEFKSWVRTHRSLAHAVVAAQAFAKVERERVDGYILPIFREYAFRDEDGQPITHPDRLYRCRDEELVSDYYAACDHAHREHGFTGPKGHCPALVAEDLQRKAEQALIDAGCKLLGINGGVWNLKHRAEMLDLLLGACLQREAA